MIQFGETNEHGPQFFYFVYTVFITIVPLQKSLQWNSRNYLLLVTFKFTGSS